VTNDRTILITGLRGKQRGAHKYRLSIREALEATVIPASSRPVTSGRPTRLVSLALLRRKPSGPTRRRQRAERGKREAAVELPSMPEAM
jgi:hypothetical protein